MRPVVFHPEGRAELRAAAAYYNGKRKGLGRERRVEVERALARVSQTPHAFKQIEDTACRRCLVERFPYAIIYTETEEEVLILAVAHQRREPNYWVDRTS